MQGISRTLGIHELRESYSRLRREVARAGSDYSATGLAAGG